MAIKILIGGSPCTHWSIAQTNNRETEPSGMGWELFKNYLIAKEKFNPDFFLYENNKSAAQAIKDQIAKELGVGVDPEVRFTYINSALVSAQNRQRFYVTNFGDIEQPEDRGIMLEDIVEPDALVDRDKSRAIIASIGRTTHREYFKKHQGQMVYSAIMLSNIYGGFKEKKPRVHLGKSVTIRTAKGGGHIPSLIINGIEKEFSLEHFKEFIRKVTPLECERLQTLPDNYTEGVSNTQRYKCLGNGWTAEVIIHLLNHALKDVPRNEEIVVLSLYDGIGTGRYCLDKMGFTNIKYHAYEIDKFPIQVAQSNYPDIIQCGDAFAVREDSWEPPKTGSEWLDDLLGVGT